MSIKTMFVQLLVIVGLWFLIPAPASARPDFCHDVCFPTCEDFDEHCMADGKTPCGNLCSCSFGSGGSYCNLRTCCEPLVY